MKKIFALMAMMILSVSMAFAIPAGFDLHKQAVVTGDWVYDGGWTLPTPAPVTAVFDMNAHSAIATMGTYDSSEIMGEAWKYAYAGNLFVNAPGTVNNHVIANTINPPDSTPGTDWTKIDYYETTTGVSGGFSQSSIALNGYGFVDMNSFSNMQSPFMQTNWLGINQ